MAWSIYEFYVIGFIFEPAIVIYIWRGSETKLEIL